MSAPRVPWRAGLLALLLAASPAGATTYNSPVVDDANPPSLNNGGDASWQPDELLFEDPAGDSAWGPFNDLQGLWVTWDADGIYFSVEGALWDTPGGVGANSVNLYIDVDYGEGTGIADLSLIDANALDAITRNFWRPLVIGADFGCDFGYTSWSGQFDLGFLDIRDPQAPVNLLAQDMGIVESRDTATNRGYEVFVPWPVFFPDEPAGRVPAGTRMALVVAQVGGGDSLSPESIPDGADDRLIERPVTFTVDADGDGIPDRDWPPTGSISGTITLDDPTDTSSVITVNALLGGETVASAATPSGGGAYFLGRLGPGEYTLEFESDLYLIDPFVLTLGDGEDRTGVDFVAERVRSGVDLSIAVADGPEAGLRTLDVHVILTRTSDGRVFRDERLAPEDPLTLSYFPIPPGDFRLEAWLESTDPLIGDHTGYRRARVDFTILQDLVRDLGNIELRLVQPTHLRFHVHQEDGYGPPTLALRFPASVPSQNFFVRGVVEIAAVDEEGNEARLAPLAGQIGLQLTNIDPRFPVSGQDVSYWTLDDDTFPAAAAGSMPTLSLLAPAPARLTRAAFRLSDDTREVLRLRADHPSLTSGDLEIRVVPRLPTTIELSLDATQLEAGEATAVQAQLLDVTGNAAFSPDVTIRFEVDPSFEGRATVRPSEVPTDAQGRIGASGNVQFSSSVADTFSVRAVADNGIEEIFSDDIEVVVVHGPAHRLEIAPGVTGVDEATVALRLVDAFGNPVPEARTVGLEVGPPQLVVAAPSSVTLDSSGQAEVRIRLAAGLAGVVRFEATDPALPVATTRNSLQLLPGLAAFDEIAPESDPDHNADPNVDLTALATWIQDDELFVSVPFASSWNGVHLALLIEVNQDAEGAFSDAFAFPISYAHPLLPDYVFTYKYQADDYADLRRPNGPPGSWQWYNWDTGQWADAFETGVSATESGQVGKTESEATFHVPLDVIAPGFIPGVDTVRLQVYTMQEDLGNKTPALDSVPHDATHDMLPDTGEWFDDLSTPTTLSQYVEVSPVVRGNDLVLSEVSFAPTLATQGDEVFLMARASIDPAVAPNPVFQLFADFSRLGGGSTVPMHDDGSEGDATAGDGLYTARVTVPTSIFAGTYPAVVQALELTTSQQAFAAADLEVEGEPELVPILSVEDPEDDDHGPNHPGEDFLFYEYPTAGVFFDGVFDLRKLEVFDVGDSLLFRVTISDMTNPAEPGAADWNAVFPSDNTCPPGARVDLNLQNIVILLDTEDGNNVGSTGLPTNRYADVAPQDAWEYALVYDGWWKGLIKSKGSSSAADWETIPDDRAWFFCANDETNTIDGFLAKSEISPEDLARIQQWDLLVLMSGHDGDSNRDNWGGVRWVNEGRAQEWQFGGGRNGEDNRERDPNIVDLLVTAGTNSAGEPKLPGRPQEIQMDYLRDEAKQRFAEGLNAVQLEATEFVDDDPPDVRLLGIQPERAVVPWAILRDSPVVVRANIFDAAGLSSATLYWRAPGEPESARRPVPMGQLRADLEPNGTEWVADLRWEDIEAATASGPLPDPTGLTDRVRFLLVDIEATDKVGNSTAELEGRDPEVLELPLQPQERIDFSDLLSMSDGDEVVLDLNEGSQLRIDTSILRALAPEDPAPRFDLALIAVATDELDFSDLGDKNPTVLRGSDRYLGMARRLELRYLSGTDTTLVSRLPQPVELSLHFPRYLLDGEAPGELEFFHFEDRSQRWILVGAHGERAGATVTALTQDLGTWAVFRHPIEIDTSALVTGLQLSPNPFSPNGDGLYDELNITYVLPFETDSSVLEVFDVRGQRVRILRLFAGDGVTNRTLGLTWDGKDDGGREVPMGIYVVRVEVKEKNSPRVERATAAVAVVR